MAAFLARHDRDGVELQQQLTELLDRSRTLALYRNKVVHSAYVFLEAGGELVGILRSDMTDTDDGQDVDFDQEILTNESFEEAMVEIAAVAFGLSQCRIQLIHWNRSM